MSRLKRGLALILIASLAGAQPGLAQTAAGKAAPAAAKSPAKKPVAKPAAAKPVYRKVNTPVVPPVAVAAPPPPPPAPPPAAVAQPAPATVAEAPAKGGMLSSMKHRFNTATGRETADTAAGQDPAAAWTPSVDMRGVKPAKYQQDVIDCSAYAQGRDDTHAGNAATHSALKVGGITAAVMGVAVVATGGLAAVPFMAGGIGMGAGAGAGIGAVTGSFGAQKKFRTVVDSCMAGRGYTVLDK